MISLPAFRVLLGAAAEGLTDAEIEHIRDIEYELADAYFEWWLRKRNPSAYPQGEAQADPQSG